MAAKPEVGAIGAHRWRLLHGEVNSGSGGCIFWLLGIETTACHIWLGIVLHCIVLRCIFCIASAWGSSPSDRSIGHYGYGRIVSVTGLAAGMAWSGIAL